ncbi:hypothetical protein SLEP1_g42722 [Rubroshorea leprosula]|uniref:Uncharacterized protein n=1 Tax=Rubroshorea leprosula TaxID=152421 RepID=A0AAV5LBS5_9ROSI|nr:hypothetical protein SLEP1_g42722 [Rubroshorea leprosula]
MASLQSEEMSSRPINAKWKMHKYLRRSSAILCQSSSLN